VMRVRVLEESGIADARDEKDSFFIIHCNWILMCSTGEGDLLHALSSQKYIPNAPILYVPSTGPSVSLYPSFVLNIDKSSDASSIA
jgi:hypothetical protein